ncbi:MAG TPA: hypothetical protein VNU02_10285, partial [Candidatus Dormibacteraeota bacterium]|nr:hypothetical protein [Candidatus Dormibacteraeota bacterium]
MRTILYHRTSRRDRPTREVDHEQAQDQAETSGREADREKAHRGETRRDEARAGEAGPDEAHSDEARGALSQEGAQPH